MAVIPAVVFIGLCCIWTVAPRPREAPSNRGESPRGSRARRLYDRGCLYGYASVMSQPSFVVLISFRQVLT